MTSASALETLIERRVRATPVAPLMGKAIDLAVEGDHHQRLLDAVLTGLRGFLADNRATFRARVEEESPWWIPDTIDDKLFAKIYSAVHNFLADVEGNPDHEVRKSIEVRVVAFAQRLRNDPELLAKGEELKNELLAHPDVRAWLGSLWARDETQHDRRARRPGQRAAPTSRPFAGEPRPATGQRGRAAGQGRRLGGAGGRARRRSLPWRGGRPHRRHGRQVGRARPPASDSNYRSVATCSSSASTERSSAAWPAW